SSVRLAPPVRESRSDVNREELELSWARSEPPEEKSVFPPFIVSVPNAPACPGARMPVIEAVDVLKRRIVPAPPSVAPAATE
ncbi:MAG: hypothetical protein ACK56I_20255, partial [bacterium]